MLCDAVEYLLRQTHASLLRQREAARDAGNEPLYQQLSAELAQAEEHGRQLQMLQEPPPDTPT